MTKKERAQMIVERLEQVYPEGICSLDYKKPHELMIAGRLSAQCTDARVNIVTKELFAKYKTIEDFANADVADIEEIIRPCGLYKTKARSIVTMCRQIMEEFGGENSTERFQTFCKAYSHQQRKGYRGDFHGADAVLQKGTFRKPHVKREGRNHRRG